MTLDYSVPGLVSIDMSHYVKKMVKEFPQENLKRAPVASQRHENLFKVQHNSGPLEKEQAKLFRTVTTQGLFLWKHGHTSNSLPNYMGTKTKSHRLDQVMLNDAISQVNSKGQINLRADGSGCLKWHCDTAFALHDDFRSHMGSTISMGDGAITSLSRKQGMNTRSYDYFLRHKDIQSRRISSIRQQKCHVAQDQWMQECWHDRILTYGTLLDVLWWMYHTWITYGTVRRIA